MGIQEVQSYLKIIRKWWWVILLFVVATVGTMLTISVLTETQYEATVTVQVSAPPPQEVPLYSQFGREALRDEISYTQSGFSEFLLAGDVAWRALETLPDMGMNGGELREKIVIDIPDGSQLMRISITAADPESAALLANTIVEIGLQQYGELRAQPTASTRQFIELELEAARAELKAAEIDFAQFQIDNKISSLDRTITRQYDLIQSLTSESDMARVEGNVDRQQAIEEIILEREAELQDMIGLSAEYNELVNHVERTRDTFNFLLDKRGEAQIKENQILELASIQIITAARPPQKPVAAIDNKLIVLGAVVSFLTGILLTFLLEYLEISGAFSNRQKQPEHSKAIALSDNVG